MGTAHEPLTSRCNACSVDTCQCESFVDVYKTIKACQCHPPPKPRPLYPLHVMKTYEDDCLQIDLPEQWSLERESWSYQIMFTKNRFIVLQLWHDDIWSPKDQYEHWKLQFTFVPKDLPGYKPSRQPENTFTDPFICGPFKGFRIDTAPDDHWPHAQSRIVFLLDDANLTIDAYGLTPEEDEQLLTAIQTLRFKDDYLFANEQLAKRSQAASRKTKRFDATDLARPRKKTLKTWMDHQMVLLMDSNSYPEDGADTLMEGIDFVMPCNDKALWLSSLTEWDVTLEFVVRAADSKVCKVRWSREAEGVLSIPSGHLHIEQTTGGLLMDIELKPGDYKVIARGFSPEGSDGGDEGVEKIQVTLVPIN